METCVEDGFPRGPFAVRPELETNLNKRPAERVSYAEAEAIG